MSNGVEPFFRAALHAVAEHWPGGPGLTYPSMRFGLVSAWRIVSSESPDAGPRSLRQAVLVPEMPFSVLPFGVRQAGGIMCENVETDVWHSQPVPFWRGIPCRLGRAFMHLVDQRTRLTTEFPVQILLPDRDPPGPRPEVVYLGMSFLRHYGFRLSWNYADLRFLETGQVDSSVTVGGLEIG
jgi:hypothetical protein